MEERGLGETLLEKTQAGNDAGPTPAFVGDVEDIDLENVAGLCSVDGYGTGERVDATAVDGLEMVNGHAGVDLIAAGILTLEVNGVAGRDGETRRKVGIPAAVRGRGGESAFRH